MRPAVWACVAVLTGCGGGDAAPANAPAAPTTAPAATPPPPPAGAASAAQAAGFPDLPSSVRFVRVSQGGWRVQRAGQFVWQRGVSAQVRLGSPYGIANVFLQLPTGRVLPADIEEVRGEEEQVVDGAWGLDDDAWAAAQRAPRVALALRFDYARIASRMTAHANVRTIEIRSEPTRLPIGQGQELDVSWQDVGGTRALTFRVDKPDPARPAVLFLASDGLGSGERATVEQLSGGDLFSFGDAKDRRAVFIELPQGWTRCRGNQDPPEAGAAVHELGWVQPKPQADATKPVLLKVAVLTLPLVLLRDLPVGW